MRNANGKGGWTMLYHVWYQSHAVICTLTQKLGDFDAQVYGAMNNFPLATS